MNSLFRSRTWSYSFRSIVIIYFIGLIIIPIISIYTQSFSSGLSNFWDNISDPLAWKAVFLTLKLAGIATIINILIGTMIGWVLVRYEFPGKSIINSLIDLPFALPTAVAGFIILLLLGPSSIMFEWFGLSLVFHEPAIVVAMVFVTFPFVIRGLQPLLEELDKSEEEAAYTLGSSKFRTFFQIIMPTMLPGILSGGMLAFSRGLAEFGAVVLIAGNIPGKTLVASVYIFGEIESNNPQGAAAVSVLLLTISFIILWFINKLSRGGNTL
ncbi:MAG: sulfate ABC transporter permease subunit CysT [Candidatus Pristimantibacillus lignocellulolyticus]|uniref:Molybdenum transport system permease n=1 Tax=Candidatus Pristimantibacillus lignocellulolyticus TaxID=2994561 RepID=A0A9J6Z9P6_9BACL|nr:MAG: sulfate ABC transporter permease subunit CysT [Candidatus Pristimantibacillus lignocellulolyticus]